MLRPVACDSTIPPNQSSQYNEQMPCCKLTDWCVSTGLVSELAAGVLGVLAMDPAPYLADGRRRLSELTRLIYMAMDIANKLAGVMLQRCVWRPGRLGPRPRC